MLPSGKRQRPIRDLIRDRVLPDGLLDQLPPSKVLITVILTTVNGSEVGNIA